MTGRGKGGKGLGKGGAKRDPVYLIAVVPGELGARANVHAREEGNPVESEQFFSRFYAIFHFLFPFLIFSLQLNSRYFPSR